MLNIKRLGKPQNDRGAVLFRKICAIMIFIFLFVIYEKDKNGAIESELSAISPAAGIENWEKVDLHSPEVEQGFPNAQNNNKQPQGMPQNNIAATDEPAPDMMPLPKQINGNVKGNTETAEAVPDMPFLEDKETPLPFDPSELSEADKDTAKTNVEENIPPLPPVENTAAGNIPVPVAQEMALPQPPQPPAPTQKEAAVADVKAPETKIEQPKVADVKEAESIKETAEPPKARKRPTGFEIEITSDENSGKPPVEVALKPAIPVVDPVQSAPSAETPPVAVADTSTPQEQSAKEEPLNLLQEKQQNAAQAGPVQSAENMSAENIQPPQTPAAAAMEDEHELAENEEKDNADIADENTQHDDNDTSGTPIIVAEEDVGGAAEHAAMNKNGQGEPQAKLSDKTRQFLENIPAGVLPLTTRSLKPQNSVNIEHGQVNNPFFATDSVVPEPGLSKEVELQISVKKAGESKMGYLNQAHEAFISGQMESAVVYYKKVLEMDKENPKALFGLAVSYQKIGQLAEARDTYIQLLAIDQNNWPALNNFMILASQEAPEDALAELIRLEKFNPEFAPIPEQIGLIYIRQKKLKEAAPYLVRATILAPENLGYRYNLAVLLDHIGEREMAYKIYMQLLNADKEGKILPVAVTKIHNRLEALLELENQ